MEYITRFNIPYSSIYGDIVQENGVYRTTGADRTGCMFCMFGILQEKGQNRFQKMEQSHPSIHNYCINTLGCGKVLDYIGVEYKNESS